jgi:hypothetical protein
MWGAIFVIASKTKQSVAPLAETWIASSLTLPCANALRLSQAMTAACKNAKLTPASVYAKASPGFADAGRTDGTGRNVKAIRKAPNPMIHEPI